MTSEQIYTYIEKQCKLYELPNEKIPGQGGWHFFKEKYSEATYWAWYGEKTGKLRIDFCFDADESIREKIKSFLNGRYEVDVPKSTFHVFFVRDVQFDSLNLEILGEAMLKYLKFMNKDFPEIVKILQGII